MKYLVDQKYYDNGRVEVVIEEVDEDISSYEYEEALFDCRGDVFDTYKKALRFHDECIKEVA
jgi:hypothetical protein